MEIYKYLETLITSLTIRMGTSTLLWTVFVKKLGVAHRNPRQGIVSNAQKKSSGKRSWVRHRHCTSTRACLSSSRSFQLTMTSWKPSKSPSRLHLRSRYRLTMFDCCFQKQLNLQNTFQKRFFKTNMPIVSKIKRLLFFVFLKTSIISK